MSDKTREEFEEWRCLQKGEEYSELEYLAWLTATKRQQKKIDELEASNPDVPCPMCGGEGTLPLDCPSEYDENFCDCGYCKSSGKVSLTKAQEYQIKELESFVFEVNTNEAFTE